MAKASVLKFIHYTVDDIQFKSVQVAIDKHEFELHPHFKRNLMEVGDHLYDLKLTMEILSSEKQEIPFNLMVSLTGHFALMEEGISEKQKEDILKKNTVAILFPFLRAIVASITTAANIVPLVLPVMNFADDSPDESLEE